MAGITLAQAQEQLDKWLEASLSVAKNQSYTIAGRTLTRANLDQINNSIDKWQAKVDELSRVASGKSRVRYVEGL